jgi:chemotaxis signal transduction protein
MHLTDTNNNVLGIVVESATGAIRTSDERIEPQRAAPIPDRVKQLLMPTVTVASGSSSGPFKP